MLDGLLSFYYDSHFIRIPDVGSLPADLERQFKRIGRAIHLSIALEDLKGVVVGHVIRF